MGDKKNGNERRRFSPPYGRIYGMRRLLYETPNRGKWKKQFFIAKDTAKSSDVEASFELIKEAVGIKEEKDLQIFTGSPKVECAVCADVPNLTDIDSDN